MINAFSLNEPFESSISAVYCLAVPPISVVISPKALMYSVRIEASYSKLNPKFLKRFFCQSKHHRVFATGFLNYSIFFQLG